MRFVNDTVNTTLPEFGTLHDWSPIDAAVLDVGGAVVRRVVPRPVVDALNAEIDAHLAGLPGGGLPDTGSAVYDRFLGHRTVRLHGLAAKLDGVVRLLDGEIVTPWARRLLAPVTPSPLLNAAELIQIGPGEPAQYPHRDTDSWEQLPTGGAPYLVNAIIALTPFSIDNGATRVAPGSHRWDRSRRMSDDEVARAELGVGDALLFRGDVLHGGGANDTDTPRRGLSISYCAGWLRTVENHQLNVPPVVAASLPDTVQELLGYRTHDATGTGGGLVGLYENGDPAAALQSIARTT